MNATVYAAARRAGCSRTEAELLAYYVETDSIKSAAFAAGLSYGAARAHTSRLKKRLNVAHLAAAVTRLMRD